MHFIKISVDQWPQHLQDQWLHELKLLYSEIASEWFRLHEDESWTYDSVKKWTEDSSYDAAI